MIIMSFILTRNWNKNGLTFSQHGNAACPESRTIIIDNHQLLYMHCTS